MVWFVSRLIYVVARLLHLSWRYRHVGVENLEKAARMGPGGSYLLGTWHHDVLPAITAQTGGTYVVLVSRSRDAEPVALTCSRLGHVVVRGSSRKGGIDKGGREAKEEMIGFLARGYPGAVTVDGPTGPAGKVKPGIVEMARRTGAPLVPYVALSERHWTFNTWDRFRLPKPFTRVAVYYGSPYAVAGDADEGDFEAAVLELGRRLVEGEELLQVLDRVLAAAALRRDDLESLSVPPGRPET